MSKLTRELESEALTLSRRERARLAQQLIRSLDEEVDADAEKLWLQEAERRLSELKSGKVSDPRARSPVVRASSPAPRAFQGSFRAPPGGHSKNIMGKTGRAILDALSTGLDDPAQLAALAQGSIRRKKQAALREAVEGRLTPHYAFLLDSTWP